MLHINLAEHSYDIVIQRGAFQEVGKWVKGLWQPQRIAVITDSNVSPIYGQVIIDALTHEGFAAKLLVVPAGEQSKSLEQATILYDRLAAME